MKNFFYPLIENPYRNKDINEAIKVLKTKKLTIGPKTDAFQKYLESNDPIGKRLGFLAQEINREINTIGSKSPLPKITSKIVEIKNELEKIKEQLQNIL